MNEYEIEVSRVVQIACSQLRAFCEETLETFRQQMNEIVAASKPVSPSPVFFEDNNSVAAQNVSAPYAAPNVSAAIEAFEKQAEEIIQHELRPLILVEHMRISQEQLQKFRLELEELQQSSKALCKMSRKKSISRFNDPTTQENLFF
jgi:predicted secreted protein